MLDGQRLIAVEEHVAVDDLIDRGRRLRTWPGDEPEVRLMRSVDTDQRMRSRLTDLDARVQDMDDAGVDLAVLSYNPPGAQFYLGADATSFAHDANDALAQMVRDRPDRFGGLGTVAPQEPERAAAEVERITGELGLGGVLISSHTHGHYLDEPEYEPLLAAVEASGRPLYLHPRAPSEQMRAPFQQYGMVAALWGYQAEAGTHIVRLLLSGVFDRHPGLTVVLGHLGEALPYWLRRIDNRYGWTYRLAGVQLGMTRLELPPSEYVRHNVLATTSGMEDPRVLRMVLEVLGADRVMFAIDYSYETSVETTAAFAGVGLSGSALASVAHGNAERAFGIAPGDGPDPLRNVLG